MIAPLTLSFMEQCYAQCCFGNEEPTHIAMSTRRREEFIKLAISTPNYQEVIDAKGKLVFNKAEVVSRERMSDGVINFANVFVLSPKMNMEFYIR